MTPHRSENAKRNQFQVLEDVILGIGVGDGGQGAVALPPPQKKNSGKNYFFRQKSCKIRAFC